MRHVELPVEPDDAMNYSAKRTAVGPLSRPNQIQSSKYRIAGYQRKSVMPDHKTKKTARNGPVARNREHPTTGAYFLSLELENIRCFSERQVLDLSDGKGRPARWTILLGENGSGKTTVLQLLAAYHRLLRHLNLLTIVPDSDYEFQFNTSREFREDFRESGRRVPENRHQGARRTELDPCTEPNSRL